jgi:hypothetical protein
MKKLVYLAILRPLILRNYRLRAQGRVGDRWYWADLLAMRLGFLTPAN